MSVDSFHQAKNFYTGRNKPVRLIVLHDMETDELLTDAEAVGNYFAGPNAPIASAHVGVDADSTVGYVHTGDTAFGAAGANADGFHIEQAGRARQSRAEWLDDFSRATIRRAALAGYEAAAELEIPHVHLTIAQVADGVTKGFTDHATVSAAFPNVSTGHTDPGVFYPWDVYLDDLASFDHPPVNIKELPMEFFALPDTGPHFYVNLSNGMVIAFHDGPSKANLIAAHSPPLPEVHLSDATWSEVFQACVKIRTHAA